MTDVHCTNCGREMEEFEDVVLVASGCVIQIMENEYAAWEGDSPYIHILCLTCAEGLEIAGVAVEEALAQEERTDLCPVCAPYMGHLPGCPNAMATVNLRLEEANSG